MFDYPPPLDKFFTIGDVPNPSYQSDYGIDASHLPILVRMATDERLFGEWVEPQAYAPFHALEAIGELGAHEYISLLLPYISELDRNYRLGDWVTEELHRWLSDFGPDALPILKIELTRIDHSVWVRSAI